MQQTPETMVALSVIRKLYDDLVKKVVVGQEPRGFFTKTDALETVLGILGDPNWVENLERTIHDNADFENVMRTHNRDKQPPRVHTQGHCVYPAECKTVQECVCGKFKQPASLHPMLTELVETQFPQCQIGGDGDKICITFYESIGQSDDTHDDDYDPRFMVLNMLIWDISGGKFTTDWRDPNTVWIKPTDSQ